MDETGSFVNFRGQSPLVLASFQWGNGQGTEKLISIVKLNYWYDELFADNHPRYVM